MRFVIVPFFILCMMLCGSTPGIAQSTAPPPATDTIRLSLPAAEKIFLQQNLSLLAQHYNIDIGKALEQQAKVWDNPLLVTDQNIYDGKFFRHGTENGQVYGEVYIQVQQLIRTSGKIRKQTQLAHDNLMGAQEQFDDLLRSLRFLLATDLNNLAQLQGTGEVYRREITSMQALVRGMDEMLKTGDVSQKDNMRIKALLFSLQNDLNENLRQQADIQAELATLLQFTAPTWVLADADLPVAADQLGSLTLPALQDTALLYRPDLSFLRTQALFQEHNIRYQKSLAVPDLNLGVEYDKLNSYVQNYWGLAISLPLPLFNRNKGNISAARFGLEQAQLGTRQKQLQVGNEVAAAYRKFMTASELLGRDNRALQQDYDILMQNMVSSYTRRQVSLLEFIDFFEAWKDTRIREAGLVAGQRNAAAEINFTTNQSIIKL